MGLERSCHVQRNFEKELFQDLVEGISLVSLGVKGKAKVRAGASRSQSEAMGYRESVSGRTTLVAPAIAQGDDNIRQ